MIGGSAERPATLANLGPGKLRPEGARHYQHLQASLVGSSTHLTRPIGAAARAERCTKYRAVLADLAALGQAKPDASVVIFTHHNATLDELCQMLEIKMPQLLVFKVSRNSSPQQRHKALRCFQAGGGRPMVFATTFATAAVGLTLTQASRVYLLEASLDPATEAQAAGRIHRLGQEKEVLVKRFFFRDSLDEAIHDLHQKVRAGEITLQAGKFPPEALAVFHDHRVTMPHEADETAPATETQRRYRSNDEHNRRLHGTDAGFDYGKAVKTRPCRFCAKPVEVAGTSVWWGRGRWSFLDGDTSDHPARLPANAGDE